MSIYIEEEVKINFAFNYFELAEKVICHCLDYISFPYEVEINLTLTDNEGIHKINKEFRGIDAPTDVLSFPMLNYVTTGDFSFLEAEDNDDFNPDTGEALLGDIVISVEKVLEQAQNYGHSIEREYAFLITHSMLHLFGFDHMTPEEAAVMEENQNKILHQMNILR